MNPEFYDQTARQSCNSVVLYLWQPISHSLLRFCNFVSALWKPCTTAQLGDYIFMGGKLNWQTTEVTVIFVGKSLAQILPQWLVMKLSFEFFSSVHNLVFICLKISICFHTYRSIPAHAGVVSAFSFFFSPCDAWVSLQLQNRISASSVLKVLLQALAVVSFYTSIIVLQMDAVEQQSKSGTQSAETSSVILLYQDAFSPGEESLFIGGQLSYIAAWEAAQYCSVVILLLQIEIAQLHLIKLHSNMV